MEVVEKEQGKWLDDMFGRKIVPGDSFMRIEDKMGGSDIRFYFLAGFVDSDRIRVQEYPGDPRTIKIPNHKSTLMLMTPDLMVLQGLVPPNIDDVVTPTSKAKKPAKATALEL